MKNVLILVERALYTCFQVLNREKTITNWNFDILNL